MTVTPGFISPSGGWLTEMGFRIQQCLIKKMLIPSSSIWCGNRRVFSVQSRPSCNKDVCTSIGLVLQQPLSNRQGYLSDGDDRHNREDLCINGGSLVDEVIFDVIETFFFVLFCFVLFCFVFVSNQGALELSKQ